MAGERAPLHALTPEDRGSIILVVSYSLATVSVVIAVLRLALTLTRKIPFGFDDATYILANVCYYLPPPFFPLFAA
jgi:hypothetical protein